MINIVHTEMSKFRALGWVQDPADFRSLCDVVAIFDRNSPVHADLVKNIIPAIVNEEDGRDVLLKAMAEEPLKIRYRDLTGTSFSPRGSARCNGIVQAAVKGQKQPFISDWPANNFLRWAHALGFIKYDHNDDTFEITEQGLRLTTAERENKKDISDNEKAILIEAMLSYPPAIRVLSLLEKEGAHLTKFEIGRQLGFVGEAGFSSFPQDLYISTLAQTKNLKEKSKMRSDWEGSADKYARMISGWLCDLGLLRQVVKEVTVRQCGETYTEKVFHSFVITGNGRMALKNSGGNSKHKRVVKNVYYELFSCKAKDREYLRLRRALALKCIAAKKKEVVSLADIQTYLKDNNLDETLETIADDLQGLVNIGLNIEQISPDTYLFDDALSDFDIYIPARTEESVLTKVKNQVRGQLTAITHEYLALIDLAYDGTQNRLFEMKTLEILTNECGFKGRHLGGSRKPDGIIFTDRLAADYGVIIDTKAYADGYNLPISQADEMERYVRENQGRDSVVNANKWWEEFPASLENFHFMFVSGAFKGDFRKQLGRISRNTGVSGAALPIVSLLLCANAIREEKISLADIRAKMFKNDEYVMS